MKKFIFILVLGVFMFSCKSTKDSVKEYDLSKVSEINQRAAEHLGMEDEVKFSFFDIMVDASEALRELNLLDLSGAEKTIALKEIRKNRIDGLTELLGEDGYKRYKRFIASQSTKTKPVDKTLKSFR